MGIVFKYISKQKIALGAYSAFLFIIKTASINFTTSKFHINKLFILNFFIFD